MRAEITARKHSLTVAGLCTLAVVAVAAAAFAASIGALVVGVV